MSADISINRDWRSYLKVNASGHLDSYLGSIKSALWQNNVDLDYQLCNSDSGKIYYKINIMKKAGSFI